jgi:3-dehydroquinate synthase
MLKQIIANLDNKIFNVFISESALENFFFFLQSYQKKNVLIVVDSVFKKKNRPDKILDKILDKYQIIYIDAGLKNKNFSTVLNILKKLNQQKISRDGLVVALGGGVIGDIAAFVASIYKRGINLIHVPTSVTAMVDSCIGGKTGINSFGQVNLIGSYYQPQSVFVDVRFLKTLKKRDYVSGLAESIKKSIMNNNLFFEFLNSKSKEILSLETEILIELIYLSIESKLNLISGDVRENSSRLLLNYGHTFGQAFESYYGVNEKFLTHGEAVSLGMVCAAKLSELLTKSKNMLSIQKNILNKFQLPIHFRNLKKINKPQLKLLMNFLKNDKKVINNSNRFIIATGISNGKIVNNIKSDLIKESFKEVLK